MRKTALMLAILIAAACTQEPDNAANMTMDANAEAGATDDVAIPDGGEPAPPGAPGNDTAPPPPDDGAPPPDDDGTPPPDEGAPPPPAGGGNATLAAAPARTSAGGTMTLTLTNGTNRTLGYNLCTSALQTASGSAVDTDRVCTMELRTLRPGRSANYRYELPGDLPNGRYRFSTGLQRMPNGGRITVTSNRFAVR